MGRQRRRVYKSFAEAVDRALELEPGTMLEGKWDELPEDARHAWLWGAGEPMRFTWRGGRRGRQFSGSFGGLIPELLARYRSTRNKMQARQLEKYMSRRDCPACSGRRLNPQASAMTLSTTAPSFTEGSEEAVPVEYTLPQLCELPVDRLAEFFSAVELSENDARIASEALKEIRTRLGFLLGVGLHYLSLGRTAPGGC